MTTQLPRRARAPFLVLVVLAVLGALLAAPTAQARPADSGKASSSSPAARAALAKAQYLLGGSHRSSHPSTVARGGPSGPAGDLTMALRDLAALKGELAGAERAAADSILKRPTDPGDDDQYGVAEAAPVCGAYTCVHYVTSTRDAPDLADGTPANGVPDWVDTTLATMEGIASTYVAAGYRPTKSDGMKGGNAKTDVYIADIGDAGLYGYCSSDQSIPRRGPYDAWAYCVLDDDYAEFPTNTPIENLQVTAAHEYFHAVQFAYDVLEDSWLLEGTAAWVEDEMYDDVNDNLQYLRNSPLSQPQVSMDQFVRGGALGGFHYGDWIFFRYLTERFPVEEGVLPTLVRDIFRKVDGAAGGPDQYSWQAISSVLKQRGTTSVKAFAAFSEANRRPARSYSEGAANRYPTARPAGKFTLSPQRQGYGNLWVSLDHLTSATARFTPKNLGAKSWKLKVVFDMQQKARGSAALITVYYKNGKFKTIPVTLNNKGNGIKSVPFSGSKVKFVEVTLVNASGRFKCFRGSTYSCQGTPLDDNLKQRFGVRAFR